MKKIVIRILVMALILLATCEIGLRIRLAYLYREPGWLLYHQFRLRTEEEINKEEMPHYYKDNMFKPFSLIYRQESPQARKSIITVESSALRSARRQLQKMLEDNPRFMWKDYSPDEHKVIEFSNNDIVLYEFLVYPDIYNTMKREARVLRKIFGATLDDLLYHNLAFYMHIDENINFTTMNSSEMIKHYIGLMLSREEPFCKSIAESRFTNVFYVITPNAFDPATPGGSLYLKYINAAYDALRGLLERYNVPAIDLMNEKLPKKEFRDYFHLSPEGGSQVSSKILEYLDRRGF